MLSGCLLSFLIFASVSTKQGAAMGWWLGRIIRSFFWHISHVCVYHHYWAAGGAFGIPRIEVTFGSGRA